MIEDEEPGELLTALDDPELRRLLHRIDEVAAGIRKPDNLCSRRLRLQDERREVLAREGMPDGTEHLAAGLRHQGRRVTLERMPERIVRRDEEPRVPSPLDHRAAGAVRERPGVVGPVNGVGRALRSGQIRGATAGIDEDLVPLPGDAVDGERHRRGRHVQDDVDAILIVPLPRDAGADVRLVLVVRRDDFDLDALLGGLEVLNRHAGRYRRSLARQIGINPRSIV